MQSDSPVRGAREPPEMPGAAEVPGAGGHGSGQRLIFEHGGAFATRRHSLVAALFLGVLTVALYAPAVIDARLISESGRNYANTYPWRALASRLRETPHHPVDSDITLQFDPWRAEYLAAIREGRLPLWSPHAYCGVPLAANGQASVFFPLNLLAWLVPRYWTFTFAALVKLWVGGLFTYLFCARRGLAGIPGLLAASTFTAGGWMTVWMGHPHTQVAMTLPMLFWGADRWVARPDARGFALLALIAGLGWLGGHPETAIHAQGAAFAYAVFRIGYEANGRLRRLLGFVGALALGLAIAGVQLVPLAEYLLQSDALASRAVRDLDEPVPWPFVVTLLVPRFFGQHRNDTWWFPIENWNLNEVSAYVGAGALLLAVLGIGRARRDGELGFFWILGGMCAAAIYVPGVQEILGRIPVLRATWETRLLLVLGFALAIAAARSMRQVLAALPLTPESRHLARGIVRVAAGLEAVILISWSLVRLGFTGDVRDPDFTLWCAVAAGAVAASAALLLAVSSAGPARRSAVAGVFLMLAVAELFIWSYDYVGFTDAEHLAPRNDLTDILLHDPGPHRIFPIGRILPPNTQALYGVSTILGYDAVEVRRYRQAIAPILKSSFGTRGGKVPEPLRPLFDRLNVKYFVAEPGLSVRGDGIRPIFRGPEGSIFLNEHAWPRAFWMPTVELGVGRAMSHASAAVEILSDAPHESIYRLKAPADGFLLVSDTFYPGWFAVVDGERQPILQWNGAFRAVSVPAGEHQVRMTYRPASFSIGLVLTMVGLLVCASSSLMLRPRDRKPRLDAPARPH